MEYSSFLFELYVLSETSRKDLPDSEFGIPKLRKYPLDTEAHVLSAIKFFNYVEPKYEKLLAKNIIRKIHEYKIEDKVNPGEKNRFSKYWNNVKKESVDMSEENKKISVDEIYNDVKVANNVNIDEVDFSYCSGEPNSEVVFESKVFKD
jgi:hypothetical protein